MRKFTKCYLSAMFLTIAMILGGNALHASAVMHDANPKKHKTVSPKTDEVDAVNLVLNNQPLSSNAIYNLSNDGVLTIKYWDSKTEGTKFNKNFSQSEATSRWVTNPGQDIRPYVKKVVFAANALGVKIDFDGNDLSYMFNGFTELEEIDFSGVKENSRVGGNISSMFRDCAKLKEVDLSWMTTKGDATSNTTWDMKDMFNGCSSLEKVILNNPGFKVRSGNGTNGAAQMNRIFEGCVNLKYVDMSNITLYGRENGWTQMNRLFWVNAADKTPLSSLEEVYFNNTKFPQATDEFASMFKNCTSLRKVEMKGNVDVKQAVSMQEMFSGCTNLDSLDLSGLGNLPNIVNMGDLLKGCTKLTYLNIDNMDNSVIKPMNSCLGEGGDRDLGIVTCTSLKTLSAKNSKVWMCKNGRGNPGSEYFDASSDENIYYFTKKQMTFVSDAGPTVEIGTKRDYIDLLTDRDGTNMPGLQDVSNYPDIENNTNIHSKSGYDLNQHGAGYLAPGVYTISDAPWEETVVDLGEQTYYRIAYIGSTPYEIENKEYAEGKGLVFVNFSDQNNLEDHVNTKNMSHAEWVANGNTYVIDLSDQPLTFKYKDAAIDVNGKLHNVSIAINKITFKELNLIPNNPYRNGDNNKYYDDGGNENFFRPVLRATKGDGIMFLNYARKGDPTKGSLYDDYQNFRILTGGSGTEIDFKVWINDANDGTSFVFNSNDLDVPYKQEWEYPEPDNACYDYLTVDKAIFGVGGESFVLREGNDISTLKFAENTGLVLVGNTVVTTGSDPSTSWSEFAVKADAKGANYTWVSGVGCTTYALRDTKEVFIDEIEITPMVTKILENSVLAAGDFEFELSEQSVDPADAPRPQSSLPVTKTNEADGTVNFGTLTFTKESGNSLIYEPSYYYPGTSPDNNTLGLGTHNTFTYTYKVKEVIPATQNQYITYDNNEHLINITIRTPENDAELNDKGLIATVYVDGDSIGEVYSKSLQDGLIDLKTKFTNTYNVATLKLTWVDDNNITNLRPGNTEGFITYEYEGTSYTLSTSTNGTWEKNGDVWTCKFGLPVGSTITDWGQNTVPVGYDFEKGAGDDANGIYEIRDILKKFDISLSKIVEVDGNKGERHTNKDFTFTFNTRYLQDITAIKSKQTGGDTTLNFTGGTAVLTLKDGESAVFKSIPYGDRYMVEETDYGIYAVATDLTGDEKTDDAVGGGSLIPIGDDISTISDTYLKSDVNITYTNSIRVIKLEADWNDEHDITGIRPDSIGGYIIYRYNSVTDTIKVGKWEKNDSVWQSQEIDFPTRATNISWGEEDVPEGYEYERGTDTGNVYKFFNNLKYLNVLVSKIVEVDGTKADRHTSKEFTYTLTTLANRTIPAVKNSTDSVEITTNAGGVATFKLKDADTMRLTRIPYGAGYSVVEGDYGIYAVSSAVTGTDTKTFDNTADSAAIVAGAGKDTITDSFLKGDVAIAYTNSIRTIKLEADWNDEKDITGIRPDSVGGYIEYTYNGVKDSIKTGTWTKVDSVWQSQEFDIPTTATVTNWGEEDVPEGYEYEKGTDTGNVYKFYNNLKYLNVLVSKTVEVDGTKAERHTSKEFTYTLTTLANRTIPAVKNGTDNVNITTDASGTATFKLKDGESMKLTEIPYGASYSVAESDYGIYAVSTAVTGDDILTEDGTASETEIEHGANVATIADSYATSNVDIAYTNAIKVIKFETTWIDENNVTNQRPDDIDGFISYTYNSVADTLRTKAGNWVKTEGDSVWTQEFDFPTTATVVNWGEETVPTAYDFTKGSGENKVYKITNTLQYFDITVSKTVEVDGVATVQHTGKDFTFTITTSLPNRTINVEKNGEASTLTTNASGVATFTLKHGETIVLKDIPYGATYSLAESNYGIYTVSSVLTHGSTTQNITGANVSQQTLTENNSIAYTNAIEVLTLEKTWNDDDNITARRPDNIDGFITYTHGGKSHTLNTTAETWVKDGNVWRCAFDVPLNSVVTTWGESVVPTGYEFSKATSVENRVCKIKNTLRKHDITISNTVTGIGADKQKDFTYTVTFPDYLVGKEVSVVKTDASNIPTPSTVTVGTDGKCTFTLKHNEKYLFQNIPYGTTYSVVESNYDIYTVTSDLSYYSGSEHKEFNYTGAGVPEQTLLSNHDLKYLNNLELQTTVIYDVEPKLTIQKRLVGRQWQDTDEFIFALIADNEYNPMPEEIYHNPNGVTYSPLHVTKDSLQGTNEYFRKASFGAITFKSTDLDLANGETSKTFTYHVRELHPAEDGVYIPGITYSTARLKISIELYIDNDGILRVKDPVYQQEVVSNNQTITTDATLPFTFSNVYDIAKKVQRLDAEKMLTVIDAEKHLGDEDYSFVLRPIGVNKDKAPMPARTDTLTDGSRQYMTGNEGHAVRFYDESDEPISETNLGDGLLFDFEKLSHEFSRDALLQGVEFEYEVFEIIPDDCINNGDGTWSRTVTVDGNSFTEFYDGIIHCRKIIVKYVEEGGLGKLEVRSYDDDVEMDFYYTDQAKTQKHYLTDAERQKYHMTGGAPLFHNYYIANKDIQVSKKWNDYDNIYGIRPASVTMRLLRDGVFTGRTVVLSESNSWTGKFEDLPMGNLNGSYTYTVEEVVPNHYEPTYESVSAHEFKISNRVVSLGDDVVCGTVATEDQLSANPTIECESFTDSRDGVQYQVARINGYCWMAENLRYKSLNAKSYSSTLSPDEEANVETYGYLYTWSEAANLPSADAEPVYLNGYIHGICPDGWHLPTAAEINVLRTNDAFALKSTEKWVDEGYNTSGFNALPAGYYNANSSRYEGIYTDTYFHTEDRNTIMRVMYGCCRTMLENSNKQGEYSIRCVKNVH